MDCGSADSVSHSVTHDDLFSDWSEGDRGVVGDADGWGVLRWESVRGHHYGCGSIVHDEDVFAGTIGFCVGTGSSGSWASHDVSATFHASTASENLIGCNGGTAEWMRVWLGSAE